MPQQHLTLADSLPKADPLTQRQKTLDLLLAHYNEAQETLFSRQGIDKASCSGALQMPDAWTPTYVRLERLLKLLRQAGHDEPISGIVSRTLYWHLAEFYLRVKWHWKTPPPTYVQRGRRLVRVDAPRTLKIVRHEDMRVERVREGLEWLDEAWTRVPPLPGRDRFGRPREATGEPDAPKFGAERGAMKAA